MTATFKLKALIPTEGEEARNLTKWARAVKWMGRPIADYLVMNANDAMGAVGTPKERAIQMHNLKAKGLRKGAADYSLKIPKPPFHGLELELKRTKDGVVSGDQEDYLRLMDVMGYCTVIAYGWDAARKAIEKYLSGKPV